MASSARLGFVWLGVSLALGACQEPKANVAKSALPPRPVLVQRVHYAERVPLRTFVGTIRPRVETDLGFRVPGKVARRLVNVGDVVVAGKPLATLDEVDLQLQAEQAEAELRAAQASLRAAEADFQRSDTLTRSGYAAVANLDRQRAAAEEARGRLLRAERALSLARNSRSYAVLTADADGVITGTSVEAGQVVAAGQPAIRLARTGEKEAVVAIPESVTVAGDAPAEVTLWSNAGRRYAAKLREISPAADPATRTYLAKFSIPKADEAVQLGMTATVSLALSGHDRVARLPLSALFNQGQGPSVWTIRADGRPVAKPVEVAGYEAKEALIKGGLQDGETVVTLGGSKLDPGLAVRPVESLQF